MMNIKSPLVILVISAVLFGCVYHKMSADEMIGDMLDIKSGEKARINILWYKGSDREYDYFGYVYSMTGTKLYKIPKGQLTIDNRIGYTDDSTKWLLIEEIENEWSASRLDTDTGVWRPDTGEGIIIRKAQ